MKLPKILKSKRGIALENAIMFMILLFTLCALLTTLTLIGHHQLNIEKNQLIRKVEIDRIGEDYIYSVREGDFAIFSNKYSVNEEYGFQKNDNALKIYRKADENQTTVLYIDAELIGGQVKINCWKYSSDE